MAYAYTICRNLDSDRPAYEADVIVCRHHGKIIFMCDAVTKKPLPASAVAERCPVCDHPICGRCAIKIRSGGICEYFRDRVDREEYEHINRRQSYG